jgi:hypothetical protein
MATMERGEGSTISRAEAALEEAQVEQVDTLKDILSTVLTQLNRIQNLDEYMQYLHSEWLATEHDLKVAIQDEATWNGLKIPTRLKLAIKAEILKRENLAAVAKLGSSKSSSSAIPAPFDVKTITQSDAYVDAMSTLEEEAGSPRTTGEEESLKTPQKESASFHPVTQGQGQAQQNCTDNKAPAADIADADVESKAPAAVNRELSVDVAYDAEESEWGQEEGDMEGEGEGRGVPGAALLLQDKDNDDECFLRYQVNQKWVKSYSPEQRSVYYFNELTEETVWTLPEGVQASREDEWAAAAPSLSEELAAEAAEAAEAEGNMGETEGSGGGISSSSAAAAAPMPQPTIYARPVQQQQEELVSPSPSAPAMPADLMVDGIYTEGPVSLEATPVSSPDQRFYGANDNNINNNSQYGHAPVDLGVEAVPAHAVLVDEEELSDSESEEDDEEDEDDDEEEEEEEDDEYYSSGGDEDVPVLPENLQMLMDMGFSEHHAARALQKAHNDMQMATIACLRQQEQGQEEGKGQQYSGFTTAPTDSITGTAAAIATDSGSRRITTPGSRGSSRGSSRTSTPDSRGLPTTTEYMRGLALADTGTHTASPYPSPREGTRPSSASSSSSGKKQRSIISRLSSSINRTISGAKKVKQAEEDRSQQLEEDD